MIRLSPLYGTAQRLGARFTDVAGWRFPEVFTTVEQEIAAVRAGCGLADMTPHGKIQIEGDAAAEALRAIYGRAPDEIGSHAAVEDGGLYRLRRDQFYLSTPPGREADALTRLEVAIAESRRFVTVTDMTHALADTRLIGPASPNVLSKVCGLDFHPTAFPNVTAKQSSLAKTRQLILRRDFGGLPAYTCVGDRSMGAYVWEVVFEAGREFGIAPVGVAALKVLEAS